jgi:hypothetical protein
MEDRVMLKKSGLQRWVALVLLSGLALSAGAAEPVAVLRQLQGTVFVSQGSAMVPAQEGMPLQAGYRVVAVAGGQAKVAYPDGCVAALPENSLLAVKGTDQCRLGQAQVRATRGFQDSRIGQVPETTFTIKDLKAPDGTSVMVAGEPARINVNFPINNTITTGPGGEATVVFEDGCEVTVRNVIEPVPVEEFKEQCRIAADIPDTPVTGIILGTGAAIAAIAAAIDIKNRDSDDRPASPAR